MSSAHDLRTFALADGGGPVKFPPGPYPSPASYFDAYAEELSRAATSIEPAGLERAAAILTEAYVRGARMFSCGIVEEMDGLDGVLAEADVRMRALGVIRKAAS